jgi:hypothetical protein
MGPIDWSKGQITNSKRMTMLIQQTLSDDDNVDREAGRSFPKSGSIHNFTYTHLSCIDVCVLPI